MAIFNVNESSLGEYLNETSARTKYVRMQKEKADKYDEEKDKIKDLAFRSYNNKTDPTSQAAYKKWKKLDDKSKKAFKQAAKYTTGEDGSNGSSWMRYQDPKNAPSGGIHIKGEKFSLNQNDINKSRIIKKDGKYKVGPVVRKPDYAGLAASLKGKEQFNKDFGGKGNKDPYEKRKVGYDSKSTSLSKEDQKWRLDHNKQVIKDRLKAKGKLKEAAEYIYSMIESAEYYENHDEVNTSLKEAAEYILAVLDESEKK